MFRPRLNLDKKLDNADFFSVLFPVSSEVLVSVKSTAISFVMQTSPAPGTLVVFSRQDLSRLTFLKVFCLQTPLSDLKMIGVFTSKIKFHLTVI